MNEQSHASPPKAARQHRAESSPRKEAAEAAERPCFIEGGAIAALVPHRGPMLWLSRILSYDIERRTLTAEYDITSQSLFNSAHGGFPAWAAFELMAQAISALSGLGARREGNGPSPGFILSVSEFEARPLFLAEGSTARIEISADAVVDRLYSFHCRVWSAGTPIARARLTVAEVDDRTIHNRLGAA
ncbi:MAG: 3-hydroxylacyl-ACP dehydratase [Treponema sp.]|jgi:predicted hotdog family 3-hydroxylacyl-ACP dehydratase|nr:3-hydroxylacyl-ACP dehydratase [Treponema sp.]